MNPQHSGASATYEALREELEGAERPAFCLAIPPTGFETVVQQFGESGCARGARVVIEKPFGNDLASALDLNRRLLETFEEKAILRIDHDLGKKQLRNMLFFRYLDGDGNGRNPS